MDDKLKELGITIELTAVTRKELRLANIQDTNGLFNAAWHKIKYFNQYSEIDDLQGLYDTIVSELVNDRTSRFYMFG